MGSRKILRGGFICNRVHGVDMSDNLECALQQIRQAMEEGDSPTAAIDEAATDYGFTPKLLRSRFTKSRGMPPEDYPEWHKLHQTLDIQRRDEQLQMAIDHARGVAHDKWTVAGLAADIVGRVFVWRRHEYAWVGQSAANPAYAISAVRVDTCRVHNFPARCWVEIMAQIAPTIKIAEQGLL